MTRVFICLFIIFLCNSYLIDMRLTLDNNRQEKKTGDLF